MAESAKAVSIRAVLAGVAAVLLVCVSLQAADPTITLEEAASRKAPDYAPVYEGRNVVVSGQVSGRPIYIVNFVHMAIQERQHGLILETVGSQFDRFAPGDWVEAHGRLTERWGLPVVTVSKISTV